VWHGAQIGAICRNSEAASKEESHGQGGDQFHFHGY
jgi:hypothetical protein